MNDCVFCNMVARQTPATAVWEDETTLAFMDIGSVNPGHILVVAKPHVENIFEIDAPLARAVFQTDGKTGWRCESGVHSRWGVRLSGEWQIRRPDRIAFSHPYRAAT